MHLRAGIVMLSAFLILHGHAGELMGLFSEEERELRKAYPKGEVEVKGIESLLEIRLSCNRRFWILFAKSENIRKTADSFVAEFGENGGLFDFCWLLSEPSVVFPYRPVPAGDISICRGYRNKEHEEVFRTAIVEVEIARAIVKQFQFNRQKRQRYYRGIRWLGVRYGENVWYDIVGAFVPPLIAEDRGEMVALQEKAPLFGLDIMLGAHCVSLDVQEDLTTDKGVLQAAKRLGYYTRKKAYAFELVSGEYRWRKRAEAEVDIDAEVHTPPQPGRPRTPFPESLCLSDKARERLISWDGGGIMWPCQAVHPSNLDSWLELLLQQKGQKDPDSGATPK